MGKNKNSDIYWNHTEKPIFIITKWNPDPFGLQARTVSHICIEPGNGIDLTIVGLKKEPPKKKSPNFG